MRCDVLISVSSRAREVAGAGEVVFPSRLHSRQIILVAPQVAL